MPVKLLHLSDIHFKTYKDSEKHLNLDSDLQRELKRDLNEHVDKHAPIQAILIGGDIAFSGKDEEYETAHRWINEVCDITKCPKEMVLTIPGNHDVNREMITENIKDIQHAFKGLQSSSKIDSKLEKYLKSPQDTEVLLKPLFNYQKFAQRYQALPIKPNELYWVKDMPLNGYTLRIRGINSALVSNETDDVHASKLVLGSHQFTVPREDGFVNLILCHHPPEWLYDGTEANKYITNRASIALYGHRHDFEMKMEKQCLSLVAGAMQPGRSEAKWEPRYNILEIDTRVDGNKNYVDVKIWARVWDNAKTKFKADVTDEGVMFHFQSLLCEVPPANSKLNQQPISIQKHMSNPVEQIRPDAPNYLRALVYMFINLPYHKKLKVAFDLNLVRDEDENLNDLEKQNAYFQRAEESNLVADLWDKVISVTSDPPKISNPFK